MRLPPSLKRLSARVLLLGLAGAALAGCVAYAPPPPVYGGGYYVAPAPRYYGPPPGYYYGRPHHYWR